MFDKIQEIVVRPINGYEATKIMKWIEEGIYTEEEILDAYKYCQVKTINYIAKYLENNKKPSWLNEEIQKEEPSPSELKEMQELMKEFYE